MTLLHQAAQKAVEAVPRFRWDQDMDVLAGPYPDGEWVRRSDVIAALQQQPEPVAMDRLEQIIDGYLEDYEMVGEAEDGRDACHTPTEGERILIKDAIFGLLGNGEWDAEWGRLIAERVAASPSTTRQQEVGSREVVAYHDKDQPNGVAWCPGYPEKLLDIVPLYAGERTSKKLRAIAAAPSTPENADGGPHG